MKTIVVCLALILPAQDGVDELLQKLRSEKLEERDAAAKKLSELGKAVRPRVEELLRDPDKEVGRRAADILKVLDRQEELAALRKAGRVRSVDLKNATLEQAAGAVFGAFGVQYRVEEPRGDLGITTVTVQFKDAGFWDAVDVFCVASSLRQRSEVLAVPQIAPLVFTRPLPWPNPFDTVGDARVFAGLVVMGGGLANHGDITARLTVAFAPWAVPKKARIEGVRISGQSVEEHESHREFRKGEKDLPREEAMLTVADLWRGGDCVKRESLKGSTTVTVEGTLVLIREGPGGPVEARIPFSIPNMAVPPVPAR